MEEISKAVKKWARGPELSYDDLREEEVVAPPPYGQAPPLPAVPPTTPQGGQQSFAGPGGWPGQVRVSLRKPLGIILQELPHGGVVVGSLQPRGNAEASGQVQPGDLLIMVGGTDVATSGIDEVEQLILNTPGEVTVCLSRAGAMPAEASIGSRTPKRAPSLDETIMLAGSPQAAALQSTYDVNLAPPPHAQGPPPSLPQSKSAISFPQPASMSQQRHNHHAEPPGTSRHSRSVAAPTWAAHSGHGEFQVDLHKPMGIVFQSQEPLMGAVVQFLQDGSPAMASGQIAPGDHLLDVNGQDVSRLDFDNVMQVIEGCPSLTRLRFRRMAPQQRGFGAPRSAPTPCAVDPRPPHSSVGYSPPPDPWMSRTPPPPLPPPWRGSPGSSTPRSSVQAMPPLEAFPSYVPTPGFPSRPPLPLQQPPAQGPCLGYNPSTPRSFHAHPPATAFPPSPCNSMQRTCSNGGGAASFSLPASSSSSRTASFQQRGGRPPWTGGVASAAPPPMASAWGRMR